mgnify:CR=1 FL=1
MALDLPALTAALSAGRDLAPAEAAAAAGVNLIISGHTHNGQIYPFNFLVSRVFDRIKGMYQIGSARQYVNEGTGTWGPIMRVGTRSEITLFEIAPE